MPDQSNVVELNPSQPPASRHAIKHAGQPQMLSAICQKQCHSANVTSQCHACGLLYPTCVHVLPLGLSKMPRTLRRNLCNSRACHTAPTLEAKNQQFYAGVWEAIWAEQCLPCGPFMQAHGGAEKDAQGLAVVLQKRPLVMRKLLAERDNQEIVSASPCRAFYAMLD